MYIEGPKVRSFKSYIAGSATETWSAVSVQRDDSTVSNHTLLVQQLKQFWRVARCLRAKRFQIIHCWFSNWNKSGPSKPIPLPMFQIIHCWFSNWNSTFIIKCLKLLSFKSYIAGSATETAYHGQKFMPFKVSNHTLLVQQLKLNCFARVMSADVVSNHTLLVQQLKRTGLRRRWRCLSLFQIIHCWFSNWNLSRQ